MYTVVLVDDHVLLRNGLANLVESFGDFKVLFQADNGQQFIEKLTANNIPDIVLMDINMPVMDGYDTSIWLKKNHLEIKILALSMLDDEGPIIKMFRAGAKGYILKDCDPSELKEALLSVATKGYYYTELITGKIVHSIYNEDPNGIVVKTGQVLSLKEAEFLQHACSEMTYKEIAEKMCLSPRTVDGYRVELFEKLAVNTRVGLVMFAIKNGLVQL